MDRMRINISDIPDLVQRHRERFRANDQPLLEIQTRVRKARQLTRQDLEIVCAWKSRRSAHHATKNIEAEVAEISHFSLTAKCERTRVESLQLLRGVNYPTADGLLHFFHIEPYPIIDFRALWSLGLRVSAPYTFDDWWKYVEICRTLLSKALRSTPSLTMREIDWALWAYSKETQPPDRGVRK